MKTIIGYTKSGSPVYAIGGGQDTITTTSTLSDYVQTAFDRLLYFALRSQPVFDAVADVRPALQPMPGEVVQFSFMDDLAVDTATLDESTDVDRDALSSSTASVTVAERGKAVGLTSKLRATGFIDVDAGATDVIAYNLVDTLDTVARDVLVGGTNVRFSGSGNTARTDITDTDTFTTADARFVTAKLRGNKAIPKRAGDYLAYIHPDVSHDLRAETGEAGWIDAHKYASPEALFAGEIGRYQGAIYIETPRAPIHTDGGSGTTDVYSTIFCGQQALAKAVAIDAHLVSSPIVDRLRRLPSYGWYFLGGWTRFREASLYRTESASSIGSN